MFLIGREQVRAGNMDCKEEISDSDSGIILNSGKNENFILDWSGIGLLIYIINRIDGHGFVFTLVVLSTSDINFTLKCMSGILIKFLY